MPVIPTFGDVVASLITYLDATLPGSPAVTVASRVPATRPDYLIRLQRTGGVMHTRVSEKAQVSVDVWAPTEEAAHDLAQDARVILHNSPGNAAGGVTVYRVEEIGGPAMLPDPLSDSPRFVFTLSVHTR